jgi:predicted dehydrogenase
VRIFTDRWRDGYRDYPLRISECRIKVEVWWTLVPVSDLYFVRRPSLITLANYVREVGLRGALRKGVSRRKERFRNQKFLSVGVGVVAEASPEAVLQAGTRVIFAAPSHPRCVERVVLPPALVKPLEDRSLAVALPGGGGVVFIDGCDAPGVSKAGDLELVAGWSPDSGDSVPEEAIRGALKGAERELSDLLIRREACSRVLDTTSSVQGERTSLVHTQTDKKLTGVLFGLGNYAKTVILPNLPPGIRLVKVHEVDPVQLDQARPFKVALDTAPLPRADEAFDVYLIAGFHHTHAAIATAALELGAAGVVEKPVATTEAQLEMLQRAMTSASGRLFVGFQRRYWRFNDMAMTDLGTAPGEPISYACEVHEEPLPGRHWYRWPVSRGRIVANGCHWIDHFLFLNHFAEVEKASTEPLPDGALSVELRLMNGATFRMRLTDRGTARTGMRNTIHLEARDGIVQIENDRMYRAERGGRAIRAVRVNRLEAYQQMYAEIFRRIVENAPGDSPTEVIQPAAVALALQDEIDAA